MSNQKFLKRIYQPKEIYQFLTDLISSAGATRGLSDENKISRQFMERLMLAVTEVNGCRYCSYFHARVSLRAGLGKDEIRRALDGDFKDAPQDELAALYFAQHYAESAGQPNPEAVQCLKDAYGEEKSKAILAYIRAIMVGNAWGNIFDALRLRLTGRAIEGLNLWVEIAGVIGPIVFIPKIIFSRAVNKILKKSKLRISKGTVPVDQ